MQNVGAADAFSTTANANRNARTKTNLAIGFAPLGIYGMRALWPEDGCAILKLCRAWDGAAFTGRFMDGAQHTANDINSRERPRGETTFDAVMRD
jgi:hypothetical protein